MPYIIRDAAGKIIQVFEQPVSGAAEPIAAEANEMTQYQRSRSDITAVDLEALRRQLAASDGGMARLVEDMVDVLVRKSVIKFTDLPAAAGNKYLARLATRDRMHAVKSIIVDAGDII